MQRLAVMICTLSLAVLPANLHAQRPTPTVRVVKPT